MLDLSRALEAALLAARGAGDLLLRDFHRPGGPRGGGDKAEADVEAERLIRRHLLPTFTAWGYLGEETGREAGTPGAPVWVVDPNDGTRDYLVGRRGSAVSIGLVHGGRAVLGVVFAFAYPDDRGDLFAWAEGCGPIRRNGLPVNPPPLPARLGPLDTVLVSSKGDRDPEGNLACCAPARYRTVPSIAHRLALVAAGEAEAASALFGPRDWDFGGGHALLGGAGGHLVDETARGITYAEDGTSRSRAVFGGSAEAAAMLAGRPWSRVETGPWTEERPLGLERGQAVADPDLLARAQGCLLGLAAGDNLGSLVEFRSAAEIASAYPDGGPRRLEDGGVFSLLAGQPTDDTEMALCLARAIVAGRGYRPEAAWEAYRRWFLSAPFDIGRTTRRALEGAPDSESQANGSLMRASPLGVVAQSLPAAEAAALARADSRLTHPHPVCGDATAAFVVAVAHAVGQGEGGVAAYEAAVNWAREAQAEVAVQQALGRASAEAPTCDGDRQGWVLIALQNAFHELLHASTVEEGVVATVRRGGDTDTNAATVGALLGAVQGRVAIPSQWRRMIVSCHPIAPHARHPRPLFCWPADVVEIAERLLLVPSP